MKSNSTWKIRSWKNYSTRPIRFAILPLLLFLVLASSSAISAVIFTENVGTPSATTAISGYSGWQNNDVLSFSGSGDVRTTAPSTGYADSSGSGNVFLTSGGTISLQISGINTVGYTSLLLSFGAFKSTTASSMSELLLEYSTDGSAYSSISIPLQPTGTGTANWRLISGISLPEEAEGVSNLRLRWMNTAASGLQFRLDDFRLEGTLIPVPEPVRWGMISFGTAFAGAQFFRSRRPIAREQA